MQIARTQLRPAASAAFVLALLIAAAPGARAENLQSRDASRTSRAHLAADGSLVDVQVKVEGRDAPLYFRPGTWDRHYFQAFKGRNYALVVRNNTGRRVGVLIAVDGINVVNGERSNLSRGEAMYVLDPYEKAEISGWRTSLDDVRTFVFVDEERSYAERTGQANEDMGWIRVLSFREVEPVGLWDRIRRPQRARDELYGDAAPGAPLPVPSQEAPQASAERAPVPAPAGKGSEARADSKENRVQIEAERRLLGAAPESNPGTGWGQRSYDPVSRTEFRAAARATDHLVLRYEYAAGLQALGIFPQRSRLWEREDRQLGFAQPPRW